MVKFYLGLLLMFCTIHGEPINQTGCDKWTSLARSITGSGRFHKCSVRAHNCNILDCFGESTYSRGSIPFLQKDIDFTYCFGVTINSCNDPISMDFYLQVPSKNFSKSLRLVDDEVYPLHDLNFSLGSIGSAYPVFNFVFQRSGSTSVNLSVRAEIHIQNSVLDIPVPSAHINVINGQSIPVQPCNKTLPDTSHMPASSFAPDKCLLNTFTSPATLQPPVTGKPSGTLNKTCDLTNNICGPRETCNFDLKPPSCECNPDFKLSPGGDSCLPTSRFQRLCMNREDCGHHEICQLNSSNTLVCQCREHYGYDVLLEMCVVGSGQTAVTTANYQTTTKIPEPTDSHANSDAVKTASSKDQHIPIYVGAGLGAAVLLGLVILGAMCFVRRRRQSLSISDRESSAPLVGGDDDNLIM